MKAKITYTVNYEDIPKEVKRLTENCHDKIEKVSQRLFNLTNIIDEERLNGSLEEISNVRLNLGDIDTILDDCYNILYGFLEARSQIDLAAESTSELSDKLQNLEDSIKEEIQ